jgi:hypothetical protein
LTNEAKDNFGILDARSNSFVCFWRSLIGYSEIDGELTIILSVKIFEDKSFSISCSFILFDSFNIFLDELFDNFGKLINIFKRFSE